MEAEDDDALLNNFQHKDTFLHLLHEFLDDATDGEGGEEGKTDEAEARRSDDKEDKLVKEMGGILDIYLPSPPLLDPSLPFILTPLIASLRSLLTSTLSNPPPLSEEEEFVPPSRGERAKMSRLALAELKEKEKVIEEKKKEREEGGMDGGQERDERCWESKRLGRLGRVVWWIMKVRGYKACLSSFPPTLPSLPLLLSLLHPVPHPTVLSSQNWELRYVLLVWLSLVSMVPFSLDAAGGDGTVDALEGIGSRAVWEGRGKEGEGGAVLLGKLFARSDCTFLLPRFLSLSTSRLTPPASLPITPLTPAHALPTPSNPFLKTSVLSTLAHLAPSASRTQIAFIRDWIHANMDDRVDQTQSQSGGEKREGSGLVRKLRIKVLGRLGVREMEMVGGAAAMRARGKGTGKRMLGEGGGKDVDGKDAEGDWVDEEEEEFEVPEATETVVDDLMVGLGDKETIVRWSSAKYISLLTSLLPPSLASQISSAIIALFAEDTLPSLDPSRPGDVDLSAVKEGRWHGACLAVAELGRRGCLEAGEHLEELIPWLLRAMKFDPLTNSHSTGTSVRDAACYVLWSLARAFSKEDLQPYSLQLARAAVDLAVGDREVSIRRAGSAAFQENVGRMGLFPHGIDVLVKTDFYSVSVRRTAFLVSAPEVAEHEVYRSSLLEHYSRTTLRHWDKEMRSLGALTLAQIVKLNLEKEGPKMVDQLISDLKTMDSTWTHGLLLGLGQLAKLYREASPPSSNDQRDKIFSSLSQLRPALFKSFSADQNLAAACTLIAHSATLSCLSSSQLSASQPVSSPSPPDSTQKPSSSSAPSSSSSSYKDILALSLKTRSPDVQETLATAYASLSQLVDISKDVQDLLAQLKTFNTVLQQTIAKVLGNVSFEKTEGCEGVVKRLLVMVEPGSTDFVPDVEARRNAFEAICSIASRPQHREPSFLTPPTLHRIFASLPHGLDDYTSDQRGDVGSFIRIASIRGSVALVSSILASPRPEEWMTREEFRAVLGKLVKLGAERIDGVRKVAGEGLKLLVIGEEGREGMGGEKKKTAGGAAEKEDMWEIPGRETMRAFFEDPDAIRWNEASSVFPRIVALISQPILRRSILEGLSLSIGSRSEGTTRTASKSFLTYLSTLPATSLSPSEASLLSITRTLVDIAGQNPTLNRVFIPVLDTLVLLFEDGDLVRLAGSRSGSGKATVRAVFAMACKDIGRIRNVQRVTSCMKIITGMVGISCCSLDATKTLPSLLGHRFPTVRSATAEQLYLVLQTVDFPVSEEIEELLLGTSWSSDDVAEETKQVVRLLLEAVS